MRLFESAVDAILILLLIDFLQDSGMLEGMSKVQRSLVLILTMFVAFWTLNTLWARFNRTQGRRGGTD